MRIFKIIVRFSDCYSVETFMFHALDEALSYFGYLVKFEIDGLLHNIWSITLFKGKKTLCHYNNFLNVSH